MGTDMREKRTPLQKRTGARAGHSAVHGPSDSVRYGRPAPADSYRQSPIATHGLRFSGPLFGRASLALYALSGIVMISILS